MDAVAASRRECRELYDKAFSRPTGARDAALCLLRPLLVVLASVLQAASSGIAAERALSAIE